MKRTAHLWLVISCLIAVVVPATAVRAQADDALIKSVIQKLNGSEQVRGTEDTKSYKILFDAYLKLTMPPLTVGPEFNLNTIHPKMSQWTAVSGWAESNAPMAQAVLACKDKNILGLPYGREQSSPAYVSAGLTADIGVGGSLRRVQFPYLKAIDTISAFVTAEMYRLMEAGQVQQALDLGVAHSFVLRQCCDRDFLAEKLHSIELLSSVMSNMRDVFFTYQDKITTEQFTKVSLWEIPFLRPDRGRLFMPEADRVLAEAILRDVFDPRTGQAIPEKFAETFAELQSKDTPLTRFGAAKRWSMIAQIHGSLDACIGTDGKGGRLQLIYDDWWRRWRVDEYDSILAISTQFDRTNQVRYAAVIYAVENVAVLFQIRNRLIAEVNGTAMTAALCAYHRTFNAYPAKSDMTYGQSARKRSNSDPYDKLLLPFKYAQVNSRQSIDTPAGRVWVEPGQSMLWSLGQDHEDQRGAQHTDDGSSGDIMLWPPIKALQREAGFLP